MVTSGGAGRLVGEAAERLGREEPDARRTVREQRQQRGAGRRVAHVAEELRGLRDDLVIGVVEERRQGRGLPLVPARELPETPEAVDAAEPMRRVAATRRAASARLPGAPARTAP